MQRSAERLRYVRRELGAAAGIVLWAFTELMPRRVPDLRRLTASAEYTALHAAVVRWLECHFEHLEANATWLRAAGRQICDRCETSTGRSGFQRDPLSVTCTRDLRAVYGCDGDLPDLLADLAGVLALTGWGDHNRNWTYFRGHLSGSEPRLLPLFWRPTAALRLPPELETATESDRFDTQDMSMWIRWASRGEPTDIVAAPGEARGHSARATVLSQPVQATGEDARILAGQALARYEHVLVIQLTALYYRNLDLNAGPGRLRKRMRLAARRG